jgi:signal transduction histidine kinase
MSTPVRMAALLGAVFVAAGTALVAWMESAPAPLLTIEAALALLGGTLAAAWLVLQPLARGVARMAAQTEAMGARLAEQNRQLAAAEKRRRELLANVSHDLRTPLASMQGYLELLLLRQGELETAEAQNYLRTAARQSERLSRLVADLIELARLEADDAHAEREPFVLAELAHDVLQTFGAEAERRQVRTAVDCGAPAAVLADLRLVERVLANLVENALRHTPAGGAVTVRIAARGEGALVTVADTGVGIAADALDTIFDRYDRARVGDSGGTPAGLGLAIARRIAALHGSALTVTSTPGAGTQVAFTLPLAVKLALQTN